MTGIIVKAIAGFYYVDAGDAVIECKARGKFRTSESPLVGDRVEIMPDGTTGTIERIFDRKNALVRPPVANLDVLFIIAATSDPAPNYFVIDKLTVYAEHCCVTPVIVSNKPDLGSPEKLLEIYRNAGYRTVCASGSTGAGADELRALMDGKICAFTGNSGVGKSSILNHIMPQLQLETAHTSKKLGRGRHTTRHTELFRCGGGYIADTPGFSSFELQDGLFIHKEQLANCFPEFSQYLGGCRFSSCSHTGEKGCAVAQAAAAGAIEKSRFESYIRMYRDSAKIPDWQLNKRKQEKS